MNTFQLSNGIRVITEKNVYTRSIAFGIWVKAGSRQETARNNGITHFIEHMLFKGTSRFTAREIADLFDGLGGNLNAFTSKENTCYYFVVLDEHLPKAMDILADMFFHSTFAADELEREKQVIFEEIAMYEDTPDELVHDLIAEAVFGQHSLGYPVLGSEDVLRSFDSTDLRRYINDQYTTSNIVISVAGHFDDSLQALIEQHFAAYQNSGSHQVQASPSFESGYRALDKETEQNHICLAMNGLAMSDRRMYALNVFNNVLGGGMSSRLFQEVRERRGLAYSVYSYLSNYSDSGLLVIYAGTAPSQTGELLAVMEHVLGDLLHNGITDQELRRTKEQLKGNLILNSESSLSRMIHMGRNQLMMDKRISLDEVLADIERVSLDDVNTLIRQLMQTPLAAALIGHQSEQIHTFRRDQFVTRD